MPRWSPRIIVIGAGFGGIAAAVRMLQDGHRQLLVVDRAADVGGVWLANTYPGAGCDVPSHLYSLSFHPKPDWNQRFAGQQEILGYARDVARIHGLGPHLRLRTEVTGCRWDDERRLWRVTLRGPDGTEEVHEAEVVIAACGQLNRPAEPAVPGLDSFSGVRFHSAQWRHDVDLAGKRVGVIGTGASAVQFVPAIAGTPVSTTVFQRSAPYIIGRSNRVYPAWERTGYVRAPALLKLSRLRQYLWHEGLGVPFTVAPVLMTLAKLGWRLRLQWQVRDRALRRKLRPDYAFGCKRLLRAPDWYPTLSRPDVELVDTAIRAVEPEGVRTADGRLHPADVLIMGTGFATQDFLVPITVTGRDGADLNDRWRDGASAYLGTMVSGFPNFFMLYGPGTNLGSSSILFMIESQLHWVRGAVRRLVRHDLAFVDVRPDVERAEERWFRAASAGTIWEAGCRSWYLRDGRNITNWPSTTWTFHRRTRRFRAEDVFTLPRELGPHRPARPARPARTPVA